MRQILTTFTLLCLIAFTNAQELLPHIGLTEPAAHEDEITPPGDYIPTLNDPAYEVGEVVNDFTVFTADGVEYNLGENLAADKPALVVSGSFTCQRFRNNFPILNQIYDQYSNDIDLVVVYTVEAHPQEEISPYFGWVNPTSTNIDEGILYDQPTIYGERLDILADMHEYAELDFPIYVDGPNNEWLETYGAAPHFAYIIGLDGTVHYEHEWLDIYPDNILADLDEFIWSIENEGEDPYEGTFTYQTTSETELTGETGTTIYMTGQITNNSDAPVLIQCERLMLDLPEGWGSSMCLDICLPTSSDYYEMALDPGQTQTYTNYFYTTDTEGTGYVEISFVNANDEFNKFSAAFEATAETPEEDPIDLGDEESPGGEIVTDVGNISLDNVKVFPNPARDSFQIQGVDGLTAEIYQLSGKLIHTEEVIFGDQKIDASSWSPGIYFVRFPDFERTLRLVVK